MINDIKAQINEDYKLNKISFKEWCYRTMVYWKDINIMTGVETIVDNINHNKCTNCKFDTPSEKCKEGFSRPYSRTFGCIYFERK